MITTTMMPIQKPFGSFCFTSSGVSNIIPPASLARCVPATVPGLHPMKKCRLRSRRIRDCARERSALLDAGTALEIALKAPEVHGRHQVADPQSAIEDLRDGWRWLA